MINRYGDADAYEEAMKNQFCAGDIDILIVCSKLLTGFEQEEIRQLLEFLSRMQQNME